MLQKNKINHLTLHESLSFQKVVIFDTLYWFVSIVRNPFKPNINLYSKFAPLIKTHCAFFPLKKAFLVFSEKVTQKLHPTPNKIFSSK